MSNFKSMVKSMVKKYGGKQKNTQSLSCQRIEYFNYYASCATG